MKRFILFVLCFSLLTFPVQAAGIVAGDIEIVSQTANTVTIHGVQFSGDPVRLRIEHTCMQQDIIKGVYYNKILWTDVTRFTGSIDANFATIKRGVVPTWCWAKLIYEQNKVNYILDSIYYTFTS